MQLDLFGNVIPTAEEIAKKMAWSFSKMQCFRDCPRRYYYQYYGSKKRVAKAEPNKAQLISLAKLSNRYMVQGHVIHLAISTFLKKQKSAEIWDMNRLISFAYKVINDTLDYNAKLQKGFLVTEPSFQIPVIKELQEGTYEANQLRNEWLDVIWTCLSNFYTNPEFELLRRGAKFAEAKIEGDTSFSLSDAVEVDGKVDLAFVAEPSLIIADWKTGKKEFQDTSLQLLVYALWAKTLTDWNFSSVRIQKAYLHENELEELSYSDLHVNRARVKILQDAELLLEMHPFGVDAVSEAFIQHKGKNCALCPFQKICHPN